MILTKKFATVALAIAGTMSSAACTHKETDAAVLSLGTLANYTCMEGRYSNAPVRWEKISPHGGDKMHFECAVTPDSPEVSASFRLSIRKGDGSIKNYDSFLRAKQRQPGVDEYQLISLTVDNVPLNVKAEGDVIVGLNAIAFYSRMNLPSVTGGFAEPDPAQVVKRAEYENSLIGKVDRYFSRREAQKFWYGR